MDAPLLACTLYSPDGTIIAHGHGVALPTTPARLLIRGLDAPGRVVQRYLAGHVDHVGVAVGDGERRPARLLRIFFDPKLGRSCELEVAADANPLPAAAAEQAP